MAAPDERHSPAGDTEVSLVSKPRELLELRKVTEELFQLLKAHFHPADRFTFALATVDDPEVVAEITDPVAVAAFTMRKVQALHRVAGDGVRTSADVVIGLAAELNRSLVELAAHVEDVAASNRIVALNKKVILAGLATSRIPPGEGQAGKVIPLD
ncbi:hypothetical protein [Actinoplanes subglobosus]|uniref:Uncharacterized protein n=1 Tax=Actinoplanes subglobosus TaxID=1547892 RepID=A0ABV8ISS4_9ACTN